MVRHRSNLFERTHVNSCAGSQQIYNKKFCPSCGAATTTTCPKCQTRIKIFYHIPGVFRLGKEEPARYCDNCGAAYPWTEAKLQAATELASELNDLTEEEKQQLKNSLPDIIRDSPQTPVAATQFKRLLVKAKDKSGELIWDLLKELVSETAKKIILWQ